MACPWIKSTVKNSYSLTQSVFLCEPLYCLIFQVSIFGSKAFFSFALFSIFSLHALRTCVNEGLLRVEVLSIVSLMNHFDTLVKWADWTTGGIKAASEFSGRALKVSSHRNRGMGKVRVGGSVSLIFCLS